MEGLRVRVSSLILTFISRVNHAIISFSRPQASSSQPEARSFLEGTGALTILQKPQLNDIRMSFQALCRRNDAAMSFSGQGGKPRFAALPKSLLRMKVLKRILFTVMALLVAAAAGGYFYFKGKFKAPPVQVRIVGENVYVPFRWIADTVNNVPEPHAAIVLPVILPGCTRTFYMQFDLGSPYSLFYRNKLEAIQARYGVPPLHESEGQHYLTDYRFSIAGNEVLAERIAARTFQPSGIDWADSTAIEIIGTIGSDLIDGKTMVLDYPHERISLVDQAPDSLEARITWTPFDWEERKILLPARVGDEDLRLFFDTGSSAFELLTDPSTWKSLADKDAPVTQYGVNSWGKTLTAHSAASRGPIAIGSVSLPLTRVTYIEGTSFIQNLLMRVSGVGGMTGNKLFTGKVMIIDTKGGRFGIGEP